jgi:transposase
MKATLIRLGIRGFNPKLRHAEQRLETLRTPEGEPIPVNTLAELKPNMQRRRFICDQIRSIERERLERLERTLDTEPHAMVRLLARVTGYRHRDHAATLRRSACAKRKRAAIICYINRCNR